MWNRTLLLQLNLLEGIRNFKNVLQNFSSIRRPRKIRKEDVRKQAERTNCIEANAPVSRVHEKLLEKQHGKLILLRWRQTMTCPTACAWNQCAPQPRARESPVATCATRLCGVTAIETGRISCDRVLGSFFSGMSEKASALPLKVSIDWNRPVASCPARMLQKRKFWKGSPPGACISMAWMWGQETPDSASFTQSQEKAYAHALHLLQWLLCWKD